MQVSGIEAMFVGRFSSQPGGTFLKCPYISSPQTLKVCREVEGDVEPDPAPTWTKEILGLLSCEGRKA